MKRLLLLILAGALLLLIAGCSNPDANVLTVIHKDGKTLRIGQAESDVVKITGTDIMIASEFAETKSRRASYWNKDGIEVEFGEDDQVLGLRLSNGDWRLSNGMKVGSARTDVLGVYKDSVGVFTEGKSIRLSYDGELAHIPFDFDSEYRVEFYFDAEDICNMIVIERYMEFTDMQNVPNPNVLPEPDNAQEHDDPETVQDDVQDDAQDE